MVKHEMAEVWSGIDARLREYEERLARQDPSHQPREAILRGTADVEQTPAVASTLRESPPVALHAGGHWA